MNVAKPIPRFGSMFSCQKVGDDWEKAQVEKYIKAPKAGKNMMRRRPELMICRSMAWTMDSESLKPNRSLADDDWSSSPSSWEGTSSAMLRDELLCSKGFTQYRSRYQQKHPSSRFPRVGPFDRCSRTNLPRFAQFGPRRQILLVPWRRFPRPA